MFQFIINLICSPEDVEKVVQERIKGACKYFRAQYDSDDVKSGDRREEDVKIIFDDRRAAEETKKDSKQTNAVEKENRAKTFHIPAKVVHEVCYDLSVYFTDLNPEAKACVQTILRLEHALTEKGGASHFVMNKVDFAVQELIAFRKLT